MIRRLLVLALLLGCALPALAAAATPEEIRECVLENRPRYSGPGDAVTAQYLGIEEICRAALDGEGGVEVQITPEAGAGGSPPDGSAGAPRAEPAETPGTSPGGTSGPAPGGDAARANGRDDGSVRDDATDASAATLVREAGDDTRAGSPFPGSDGGAPTWLLVLGGCLGALVLAGAGVEVRRRLR